MKKISDNIQIEQRTPSSLLPYQYNARTHSKAQIRQIAASIEAFGFTNPVLIDEAGMILAGHGRVAAARLLGLETVPVLRFDHMSKAQKQAYILADNKLAANAGWDAELLAIELGELLEFEDEIDISLTGFAMPEIDLIIDGAAETEDEADTLPEENSSLPPRAKLGDLWQLGRHRLLVDDATKTKNYQRLMGNETAGMIFTDPPYNVPVDGHICGLGKAKHEAFAMASGEMSEPEFTAFLTTICTHMAAVSRKGALHFICMDWRHAFELLTAGRTAYNELKNICIWNKNNGGMGSLYRSKHEMVFVFKSGAAPHINNVELGQHGRYRTNVWDYADVNSLGATGEWSRAEALAAHPTVKPVQMVADAILDCSNRGDWILDPFLGSGTTFIAAERVGRSCAGMEISPKYADIIIRRWENFTGEKAVCHVR